MRLFLFVLTAMCFAVCRAGSGYRSRYNWKPRRTPPKYPPPMQHHPPFKHPPPMRRPPPRHQPPPNYQPPPMNNPPPVHEPPPIHHPQPQQLSCNGVGGICAPRPCNYGIHCIEDNRYTCYGYGPNCVCCLPG